MQIQGPANLHGAHRITGPNRIQGTAPQAPAEHVHAADQLDISPEAEMVGRVHDLPEIRADRVADIRRQIEAGTYETGEKLDIALGRLLDEIAG